MQDSPLPLLTAIVIEPDQADRHWVRMMLAEAGVPHVIVEFPSAIAAIESLQKPGTRSIDLVLITVAPPLFDIQEAVSRLSRLPALEGARFAVTIVSSSEASRVPRGCQPLMKPVTADSIRDFLRARCIWRIPLPA